MANNGILNKREANTQCKILINSTKTDFERSKAPKGVILPYICYIQLQGKVVGSYKFRVAFLMANHGIPKKSEANTQCKILINSKKTAHERYFTLFLFTQEFMFIYIIHIQGNVDGQ